MPRRVLPRRAVEATSSRGGDFDGAIAEYRAAISLDPDYVHTYNNFGVALEMNRDLEEAITAYRKAPAPGASNLRTFSDLLVWK